MGVGGVRVFRALGISPAVWHANEGHSAFLTLERVREWTRTRFGLPADAAVLVAEIACGLPGCPPRETVVAFWSGSETRHRFTLFKPVAEVVADDLPPAFMKGALAAIEMIGKVHLMPGGAYLVTLTNGEELQVSRIQSRVVRERLLKL